MMLRVLATFFVVVFLSVNANAQFGIRLQEPLSDLNEQDLEMLRVSIRSVLDAATIGGRDNWDNPETLFSGESILLELFDRNEMSCARVVAIIRIGDGEYPFDLRMCQRDDGTWGLIG